MADEFVNLRGYRNLKGGIVGFIADDVPDIHKWPSETGINKKPVYSKAPGKYGGLWWQMSPFNQEPWHVVDGTKTDPLPPGFVEIFGPKPNPNAYDQTSDGWRDKYRMDLNTWSTDLNTFVGYGLPDGTDGLAVDAAEDIVSAWIRTPKDVNGFTAPAEPHYYTNDHGPQVRFPTSQVTTFQSELGIYLTNAHHVVGSYHASAIAKDIVPVRFPHPWDSPTLRRMAEELMKQQEAA